MHESDDVRSLMQTLGGAALGIGIGLGILVAGFFVSNIALSTTPVVATTSNAPGIATLPSGSPRPASSSSAPQPSATVAAVTTPAPTPTPVPTTTPDPMVVTGFSGQGLRLAALTVPAGYTVTSPIAGRVSIVVYQYIDGEVRTGAETAGQPNFPYIFIRSADREVKIRPGALDRDIQMIVKDGDTVGAGTPLFKTVTTGASSWRTFYDNGILAQVVASVTQQPANVDLDPVPVFKR
jgi:biotin carboxyl carrier protein